MRIKLDTDSELQLYRQLVNELIRLIVEGHLQHGDSLPSIRSLAADLGVNIQTVHKSYQELERKGLIQTNKKSKATVCVGLKAGHDLQEQRAELREAIVPSLAEAYIKGMKKEEILHLVQDILNEWE